LVPSWDADLTCGSDVVSVVVRGVFVVCASLFNFPQILLSLTSIWERAWNFLKLGDINISVYHFCQIPSLDQ